MPIATIPAIFWDLFGEKGHPIRTTISEMGPLLLARLLDLNDTQEGVLNIAFRYADDNALLLLDLEDLQAMLQQCATEASALAANYGNVSKQSVGTIQRALLELREPGRATSSSASRRSTSTTSSSTDDQGRGDVNILAADKLMQSPKLYATFLLWLLSELFEPLPEVGDPDKPKLVFFFDEAHLLFDDAPKALLRQGRAGGAADPLQGRRRLFRHAEPARRARHGAGAARQPRAARAARLHAARPEGGQGRGRRPSAPTPASTSRQAITELEVGEALVSMLRAGRRARAGRSAR